MTTLCATINALRAGTSRSAAPRRLSLFFNPPLPLPLLPLPLQRSKPFHGSASARKWNDVGGRKCGGRDIFDANKIQKTMNKVMGVRGPFKKVAYKPGIVKSSGLGKHDFQTIKDRASDEEDRGSPKLGPSTGSERRARQLSDVMFLRIAEMVHSGSVHPIFYQRKVEIVKVKMLPDMRNVHVFWAMTGNAQDDADIHEQLTHEAGWQIRRQMAELQMMGRVPTVTFIPDESRIRLNQISRLIEIADKPPKDDDDDNNNNNLDSPTASYSSSSSSSSPEDSNEEAGVDLGRRIAAFSFDADDDAPTWRRMKEAVVVVRDARNLNHDHLMSQVLRARISANPDLADEWRGKKRRSTTSSEEDDRALTGSGGGGDHSRASSSSSWRFNARNEDRLSTFLRERKRKMRSRKDGEVGEDFEREEDDEDDDDDDDDDCGRDSRGHYEDYRDADDEFRDLAN